MSKSCPINFQRVDAVTIRIVTILVFILLIVHVTLQSSFVLFFLMFDFMVRLYLNRDYSPLYRIALQLQKAADLQPRYEDAAAKRLASHFGLLFVILLYIGFLVPLPLFYHSIAAIFLGCAALEILFGFCVGCKVYFLLKQFTPFIKE